ncbi:MAG: rhodanese-like domain-containing protein [Ideonella sp.]|nr:rhodanese-like domain-containing protein [Ideonella sp.]
MSFSCAHPQRLTRRLSLCLLMGALSLAACSQPSDPKDKVTLDQARADHEAGKVVLIDIREPSEHATGVAQGAKLLPMSQLRQRAMEIPTDPSKPVYLICNTQNRSGSTLAALRQTGRYQHVRYVHGGMSEWAKRGWPMVKPQ